MFLKNLYLTEDVREVTELLVTNKYLGIEK